MKKITNIQSFMGVCSMITFGILAIPKLGRPRHKGVCESAGTNLDNRLKRLSVTLNTAVLFVKHVLRRAR